MYNLYRTLLEGMSFPIWVRSIEGVFTFVNESFSNNFDKRPEEFIGKTVEEVMPKKLWDVYNKHCDEVIKYEKNIKKEINEGEFHISCNVIPIKDKNGKIECLAGILNITNDMKKLKEGLKSIEKEREITKTIIDKLPGTIFYKDIHGKYIYANEECLSIYRNIGVNNIIGKKDSEINLNEAQVNKFVEDDKKIIETRLPIFNNVIFNNGDGTEGYKEVVKVPLFDNHGNVVGIIGRALDVTEEKNIEDKLEYLSYTDALTGVNNRLAFDKFQKKFSKKEYLPLCLIMGDVNGLKVVNDTFGHIEGDRLLIQITNILINTLENRGKVFRFGGDEFVMIIPNFNHKDGEEIISEINSRCEENNSNLYNLSIALGYSVIEDEGEDLYNILKEVEEIVYRKKLFENNSIKNSILNSLKVGLEINGDETDVHNERLSIKCKEIGKLLNLNSYQIDELMIAADFHDIGMIGVNKDIILKKTKLTGEEFECIKSHTEKGYRIIKAANELKRIAEAVLYHHEKWDGTGYPMGLRGREIPLYSRIISICDGYDGMTNDKVYKKAVSKEEAILELKKCKGTQFDPELTDIFISTLL